MDRETYINSLRTELVSLVSERLSPIAKRYGYSEVPLESTIKWRPMVLVIGNYSSGKSTLINEFLGGPIQATGQAPTDDSFTVITFDENEPMDSPIHTTEDRDGKFLLNDPEYPFESLKKHGQRFAAHFRLKKVNSPFLKNLAIIDTPGMHDSITEQDRGYNYQEVIGDLAQIADLIMVLFDPHKAGTVREAHTSLKDTLPASTFEDRILFVLNRIDECNSMIDMLRVYGTLCWNLSQMTGRKDIPTIRLTYSQRVAEQLINTTDRDLSFLRYLENQRDEIKETILNAPRYRLDHLATYVEVHSERLVHFLEALTVYRKRLLMFRFKFFTIGLLCSMVGGGAALVGIMLSGLLPMTPSTLYGLGGGITAGLFAGWIGLFQNFFMSKFHDKALKDIDSLTPLETQIRKDNWKSIKAIAYRFLKKTAGRFSLLDIQQDHSDVIRVMEKGTKEIREALNELSSIRKGHKIIPKASIFNKRDEFEDFFIFGKNYYTGVPSNYL